ncbi:MAG: hypothetical protein AMDU1_APLC00044G0057 [Thermoplasmatales archaeon A-plasma]|nr:MAG: hypothetical protein AMDU1_APLC00044G0057 [Thermoplasmatales archaeon A-plasma]
MVQIIHPEVGLNLAIFAMLFAILSTELMAASAILFKYRESEQKVFRYLVPIWEVTGTFFVFYVVNLEALIPSALPLIGVFIHQLHPVIPHSVCFEERVHNIC